MARAVGKSRAVSKDGYHHGDLRRALIDAALSLVAEGRVGDVSLREVARRAGVTYAAPYHHFADKSALLAAVATQGFETLVEALERATTHGATPRGAPRPGASPNGAPSSAVTTRAASARDASARASKLASELQAMAEAYVGFALAHPSHYRVMYLPDVKRSPEAESMRRSADRALGLLLERVARARPSETEHARQMIAITAWAALHGLSLLAIDGLLQDKLSAPASSKTAKASSHASEVMVRDACRTVVGMILGAG